MLPRRNCYPECRRVWSRLDRTSHYCSCSSLGRHKCLGHCILILKGIGLPAHVVEKIEQVVP